MGPLKTTRFIPSGFALSAAFTAQENIWCSEVSPLSLAIIPIPTERSIDMFLIRLKYIPAHIVFDPFRNHQGPPSPARDSATPDQNLQQSLRP